MNAHPSSAEGSENLFANQASDWEPFFDSLKAALIAGVPLELGRSIAPRGFSGVEPNIGGDATLEKISFLKEQFLNRLKDDSSSHALTASRENEDETHFPDRFWACARFFQLTGETVWVLEALSNRLQSQRHLSRLLRSAWIYLVGLATVGVISWIVSSSAAGSRIAALQAEVIQESTGSFQGNDVSGWIEGLFAFAITLTVIAIVASVSRLAIWLDGGGYVGRRSGCLSAGIQMTLLDSGLSHTEAIDLAGLMMGLGHKQRQQSRLDFGLDSSPVTIMGQLDVRMKHLKQQADSRLVWLTSTVPITLVLIIGGTGTLAYCMTLFGPLAALLFELSLPSHMGR